MQILRREICSEGRVGYLRKCVGRGHEFSDYLVSKILLGNVVFFDILESMKIGILENSGKTVGGIL